MAEPETRALAKQQHPTSAGAGAGPGTETRTETRGISAPINSLHLLASAAAGAGPGPEGPRSGSRRRAGPDVKPVNGHLTAS